ncbi:hypothetical protein SAMN05216238_103125 [Lentibacillus persicus]|uniref:Uncharacterized protein n=1 Tax=Lentibacillus persicus TaxID=640948 RepID=A0A1I1UAZ8_9BACI|nr:hypothetical protein [Lentibacillus persicus]SFD68041.1 hypothetical protein SAMN05216238_103125 [Lentibacillus persicus]
MKRLQMTSLLLLTILLISDFFPNNPIFGYINNDYIFWILLVALGILTSLERSTSHLQQIFSLAYLILLLVVLTLLGGKSAHGFAVNQGAFWIIVLLFIIDMISNRKEKAAKET